MIDGNCSFGQDTTITADALSVMIEKEQSAYRCNDYLSAFRDTAEIVTTQDRQQLVDWCFAIIDACKFQRETVSIALQLFDRFLSIPSRESILALHEKSELQLLVVGALYIAIKINERVAFPSEFFSEISRGGYSVQEIEETEKAILVGLSWRINGPTTFQVAMHILSLLNVEKLLNKEVMDRLIDEVQYQTENAARFYDLSIQRPSTVALNILFRSFGQLEYEERLEVFTELLPILRAFDFERSWKKAVAVGFMRSSIARCESIVSLDKFEHEP
jgi:hypothetical protein